MSATVFERLLGASGASQDLTRRYADDARIFPSRLARVALAALFAVMIAAPFALDDFWTSVLIMGGITSIGAIGLNLLSGKGRSKRAVSHAAEYAPVPRKKAWPSETCPV